MREKRNWSWIEKDGLGNHWLNYGKLDYATHLYLREVCRTIDYIWNDLLDFLELDNIGDIPDDLYNIYADEIAIYCKEMYENAEELPVAQTAMRNGLGFFKRIGN